jgi:hypothetical protein
MISTSLFTVAWLMDKFLVHADGGGLQGDVPGGPMYRFRRPEECLFSLEKPDLEKLPGGIDAGSGRSHGVVQI